MLDTRTLVAAIREIGTDVAAIRDTLNAADRRVGDGDTGMTIEQVVNAWQAVEPQSGDDVGGLLVALGRATANASGSSLASVLAIALRAAGHAVRGQAKLDRSALVGALAAARESIVARSGASPGDKTILDSIVRIEEALSAASDASILYPAALQAAEDALAEFRDRETRVGRARIYGAKSAGSDDPGMLAALLLLRAAQ